MPTLRICHSAWFSVLFESPFLLQPPVFLITCPLLSPNMSRNADAYFLDLWQGDVSCREVCVIDRWACAAKVQMFSVCQMRTVRCFPKPLQRPMPGGKIKEPKWHGMHLLIWFLVVVAFFEFFMHFEPTVSVSAGLFFCKSVQIVVFIQVNFSLHPYLNPLLVSSPGFLVTETIL